MGPDLGRAAYDSYARHLIDLNVWNREITPVWQDLPESVRQAWQVAAESAVAAQV